MRSTMRLTGHSKKGVFRLQREIGEACAKFHAEAVRNVKAKLVQVDEIWSFTYAKQKNIPAAKAKEFVGDTWTWIGMDSESKLVISWHVGKRESGDAYWFIHDLKERLANRVQLTSDGHKCYLEAVEDAFGEEIDYAMLIKLYGAPGRSGKDNPTEVRYSPPLCIGSKKRRIIGRPLREFVSTSHVERQNLTVRMASRRFTRLTNGFSKKVENHQSAVALHFVWYNFVRIHQTLRVTPAMEAGLTDHVWSLEDVAALLEPKPVCN